jgi:hypothetical protein
VRLAVDPATPKGAPRLSTPETGPRHDSRAGELREINGKGEETVTPVFESDSMPRRMREIRSNDRLLRATTVYSPL